METTYIEVTAFQGKQGKCPHCGVAVDPTSAIESVTKLVATTGAIEIHKIIECANCLKRSPFVVTL